MVFQEPYESLNPRFTVRNLLDENLYLEGRLSRTQRESRVKEILGMVQIPERYLTAYPHELTGGEQQRVAIGRALSTRPALVVLDEPTSALDISVRADIIRLLREVQEETGVSYLFISHDMTAVKEIASRVAIMYLGQIVEVAPHPGVFDHQYHPYGKALLASVLLPDPDHQMDPISLSGEIPSPVFLPTGCQLHPRCPFAIEKCVSVVPAFEQYSEGRWAACHRVTELGFDRISEQRSTGDAIEPRNAQQ
jgi:oligopeptide/dipeptide ABC transporter ATP-binding protein